jgi:hypothetical protein
MSEWVYMHVTCSCEKLMMNDVEVVELCIKSCLNEVVVELDTLLLLIYTMGIPFCEVVV